jgi:hypothetical protein
VYEKTGLKMLKQSPVTWLPLPVIFISSHHFINTISDNGLCFEVRMLHNIACERKRKYDHGLWQGIVGCLMGWDGEGGEGKFKNNGNIQNTNTKN